MRSPVWVRLLAAVVIAACGGSSDVPAQSDTDPTSAVWLAPFATSRDPAVRAASAALADGRPWRAGEILDSAFRNPTERPSVATLLLATAAARWGGWARVERELGTAGWVDTAFDGRGRELLARSALARSADSLARFHAERALASARTDTERGVRLVLLARALDRQALGDSAAATYSRAVRLLPSVADWLELRAAGATANAGDRRRRYGRVANPVARARVEPTEAQARERWRDFAGAAEAYERLGQPAEALRLRLLAADDAATRATIRADLMALLGRTAAAAEARAAIALVDSLSPAPTPAEELVIARAATNAGVLTRAATGYARAEREGLAPADRYAQAMVLSRLGRDADAAKTFARVPANAPIGPVAAYQRARSLMRANQGRIARSALRNVANAYPNDTAAAAPALFLLADLATDDGRDTDARAGFLKVAAAYPSSPLAPVAMFRAAIVAYAGGSFDAAARELDSLVRRYPAAIDRTAARYWAGRARERRGDSRGAAERWREVMATDPLSYYSTLSARRLRVSPWTPATASSPPVPRADLRRAVERAELLDDLGMVTEEGFEYDALASGAGASPDSLLATADALRERGEVSRAIAIARRALAGSAPRDTRLFALLYPVAYGDVIRAEASARNVDPALVAALIHQESGFNPRAASRAGALGLMQVLPSVGSSIARAARISAFERVLLFQPDVNIRLGTMHLAEMLRQYPNITYALAAYNAGGSPVRRWRTKAGTSDPELFIERIPYDETRDYVRILLRNQATYRALYRW